MAKRASRSTTQTKAAEKKADQAKTAEQPKTEETKAETADSSATDAAPQEEPAATTPRPARVRVSKTMAWKCGQVFRKHGWEQGITDEMCKDFDAMRDKDDLENAAANLAWAWHVLNGFTEQFEVSR